VLSAPKPIHPEMKSQTHMAFYHFCKGRSGSRMTAEKFSVLDDFFMFFGGRERVSSILLRVLVGHRRTSCVSRYAGSIRSLTSVKLLVLFWKI
jgi:hypothetical protein